MNKKEFFTAIAADVSQGELAFPTSARVAMKVRQALGDPGCHLDAAAKLVQAEPLLSARVVAIANSVAFNRSGREITDVRTSVARLGFSTLRSLAAALVTRQLAGGTGMKGNEAGETLAAQLWEHTACVASLAHVLARRVTKVDPDTAMFAGIVHEVGGFYLLSRAKEYPGLLDGDFDAWTESGEAEVGRAVLKVLAVPEQVLDAINYFWNGYMGMPATSLGDTLLLAAGLSPVPSPLRTKGSDDPSVGMAASIDMMIGEESLSSILEESYEEVRSLTEALKF